MKEKTLRLAFSFVWLVLSVAQIQAELPQLEPTPGVTIVGPAGVDFGEQSTILWNFSDMANGRIVAYSGGKFLVGAPAENTGNDNSGAVYIYSADSGQQIGKLTPPDPSFYGRFGSAVAIDGNTAVIGTRTEFSGASRAYVFNVSTGQVLHQIEDPLDYDYFAASVAVDEESSLVLVGSPTYDTGGGSFTNRAGAVIVYDLGTGLELRKLDYSSSSPAFFGIQTVLDENVALVSGEYNNSLYTGPFVYNAASGQRISWLRGENGSDLKLRPLVDGNIVVAGGNDGLYLFEASTGSQLAKYPTGNTSPLAIDGDKAIVWHDGGIKFMNLATGRLLIELVLPSPMEGSNVVIHNERVWVGLKPNPEPSFVQYDLNPYKFSISTQADSNSGTVSGGGDYYIGEDAVLTATPEPGYVFTGWSGDYEGIVNPLTILVEGDFSVQANFAPAGTIPGPSSVAGEDLVLSPVINPGQPDPRPYQISLVSGPELLLRDETNQQNILGTWHGTGDTLEAVTFSSDWSQVVLVSEGEALVYSVPGLDLKSRFPVVGNFNAGLSPDGRYLLRSTNTLSILADYKHTLFIYDTDNGSIVNEIMLADGVEGKVTDVDRLVYNRRVGGTIPLAIEYNGVDCFLVARSNQEFSIAEIQLYAWASGEKLHSYLVEDGLFGNGMLERLSGLYMYPSTLNPSIVAIDPQTGVMHRRFLMAHRNDPITFARSVVWIQGPPNNDFFRWGEYSEPVKPYESPGTTWWVSALNPFAPSDIRGYTFEDSNENGVLDINNVQGSSPDILYVIDVSGSTTNDFGGTPVGDVNLDGRVDTVLDAQLAALIAFHEKLSLTQYGGDAHVGIVVFGSNGKAVNLNGESDAHEFIPVRRDSNSNGITDIVEALSLIQIGHLGAGEGTSFGAALDVVIAQFNGRGTVFGEGNLLFMSDGASSYNPDPNSIFALESLGIKRVAIGVGSASSLDQLRIIDVGASQVTSSDELLDLFLGDERLIAEVPVFVDLNADGIQESAEPSTVSIVDQPLTTRLDETGLFEFTDIANGVQLVRLGLGTRWRQTSDPEVDLVPVVANLVLVGLSSRGVVLSDSDGDGIDDQWERDNFGNLFTADSGSDYDQDDVSDLEEFKWATDPRNVDTDNDGLYDGAEINVGLNPLVSDGISDAIEAYRQSLVLSGGAHLLLGHPVVFTDENGDVRIQVQFYSSDDLVEFLPVGDPLEYLIPMSGSTSTEFYRIGVW